MALIALFVGIFVGGPLAFFALTRRVPTQRVIAELCALTVLFLGLSLFLRFGAARASPGAAFTLASMLLIWWAWIAMLSFVTQVLRASDPSSSMRRITAVLGAMGTTVPWFGLASARILTV